MRGYFKTCFEISGQCEVISKMKFLKYIESYAENIQDF